MNRAKRELLKNIFFLTCCSLGVGGGEAKIGPHTFTLADGYEVELVAGPPLVDRPIVADFDELGRLYVADSSGSNDPVAKQLQDKPHRIVRLEDADGDGVFDKSVVFADRMMFPEGAMWHEGSLYVSAPPSIWKLTDTDGDGVADKREEWLDGKTLTGCANDLHGPYLGRDGWIYWCKGAFAEQTYERPGRAPFVSRAAHIFRRRPEGGPIEAVMTGGMDNPVDLVFTREGERIFTTTFFQHPAGGKRDGLIHAIYGGVYGKVHDVLEGHPRTGEIMPVLTHMGPAAPSGLVFFEAPYNVGGEYQGTLFACQFNLRKVTNHRLHKLGASFQTVDADFLVSDQADFHPTDVVEDADGSLLVIDTGGWYKLCCPTSQLYKPDVLGAIYRVQRKGEKIDDSRGMNLNWEVPLEVLVTRLGDARPTVRKRASLMLSKKADAAVKEISRQWLGGEPVLGKTNNLKLEISQQGPVTAIWTLTQIDSPVAREAVRESLRKALTIFARISALHSIAVWRDETAVDVVKAMLQQRDPHLVRVAAEAAGRIGKPEMVPWLLQASELLERESPDRVLEHSLIYALIELNRPELAFRGVQAEHPNTVRVALIALDQMEQKRLRSEEVQPLLFSRETMVREAALWVSKNHPEWGKSFVTMFRKELEQSSNELDPKALEELLVTYAVNPEVQQTLVDAFDGSEETRKLILRVMQKSKVKEVPSSWAEKLISALGEGDLEVIGAIRALPFRGVQNDGLRREIRRLVGNADIPAQVKLAAFTALPGSLGELEESSFRLLLEHASSSKSLVERDLAVRALGRARLNEQQLFSVAELLHETGPMEMSRLLQVFESSKNEALGRKVIEVLQRSGALHWLSSEQIQKTFAKMPEGVRTAAEAAVRQTRQDEDQQRQQLESMLGELKEGDVRRGQAIFNSERTACASCHAIGYVGGQLGPDLTKVGQIRSERDLLESILFPSASFVRSYEPVVVVTKDGEQYHGILRKDAPDEVILATGPGAEVRFFRSEVKDIRPGTVSLMPQGLDGQLSKEEIADLLAFLKASR